MILNESQIESMKAGGKILSGILKQLVAAARPGVTTKELDQLARQLMNEAEVKPSFLGYQKYPAVVCTSINDEAVHAIPSDRMLQDGNLLKIDFGVLHEGLHTDMAVTVLVSHNGRESTLSQEEYKLRQKLIRTTQEALSAGIKAARAGKRLGDIGEAVYAVAEKNNLFVLRELGGHGIGTKLHEEPFIPNYRDGSFNDELVPGMAMAIEPIFSTGTSEIIDGEDGFAYATKDGSLSAHFEHTIIITSKDPTIVTK